MIITPIRRGTKFGLQACLRLFSCCKLRPLQIFMPYNSISSPICTDTLYYRFFV